MTDDLRQPRPGQTVDSRASDSTTPANDGAKPLTIMVPKLSDDGRCNYICPLLYAADGIARCQHPDIDAKAEEAIPYPGPGCPHWKKEEKDGED